MRSRWLRSLPVAVLLIATPTPGHAAGAQVALPAGSSLGRRAGENPATPGMITARYTFNGRSSAILDVSGHGHTLSVVAGHGGIIQQVVHGQGLALAFPAHCRKRTCPHVALQTPSSADLNPGRRNISYGADVLLPPGQTSSGQNVVQKGYSTTSSQWKLQVDGVAGRPSCVLVDVKRVGIWLVTSTVSVADGQWHAVQCRRSGANLAVLVDGVQTGQTVVPAGLSITNRRPMSIGGKGAFLDNDQFNGALDNVWVQIG